MKVTFDRLHRSRMVMLVVSGRGAVAMLIVGRRGTIMSILEKRGRGTTAKLWRSARRR
jgi:hypothetical protein